jgi:hypothetical protein
VSFRFAANSGLVPESVGEWRADDRGANSKGLLQIDR